MGPLGMSQQDMLKVHLAQAKGERKTLEGRVLTTKASIECLETALKQVGETQDGNGSPISFGLGETDTPENPTLLLVTALTKTNLTQLKANLEEGMARIEYLDHSIKNMEAQQGGLITNPGGVLRRGRN